MKFVSFWKEFQQSLTRKETGLSSGVETLITALYLAGVSSNKFQEALSSVFGEESKGFSPATIIRLTRDWAREFQEWKNGIYPGRNTSEAMAFKLCQQVEKGWRRLKGFEKLEFVVKDIKFENGELKEVA